MKPADQAQAVHDACPECRGQMHVRVHDTAADAIAHYHITTLSDCDWPGHAVADAWPKVVECLQDTKDALINFGLPEDGTIIPRIDAALSAARGETKEADDAADR